MNMLTLPVETRTRETMIDITALLQEIVGVQDIQAGVMVVYTPHTTTGLTINEGADPDVCRDILSHLRELIPKVASFRHAEGNSDAHIKASLFGSSVHIIIESGRLMLGTWQRVFLGEFDGPRKRTLWIKLLS